MPLIALYFGHSFIPPYFIPFAEQLLSENLNPLCHPISSEDGKWVGKMCTLLAHSPLQRAEKVRPQIKWILLVIIISIIIFKKSEVIM